MPQDPFYTDKVNFICDETTLSKLRRLSEKTDRTSSEVIREAIVVYFRLGLGLPLETDL